MDLYSRVWECTDRDPDYVCPGQFNTLCPEDEFAVQCGCVGEVWMVPDCQEVQNFLVRAERRSRVAIQYTFTGFSFYGQNQTSRFLIYSLTKIVNKLVLHAKRNTLTLVKNRLIRAQNRDFQCGGEIMIN